MQQLPASDSLLWMAFLYSGGGVARKMTHADLQHSWFVAPPLAGKWVLLWILISLPVALVIRNSMHCTELVGDCCTPLLVFVMLTAILFGTWAALISVAAAAAVLLLLYSPPVGHAVGSEGEAWGLALFVLYCLLTVGAVQYVRRCFVRFSRSAGTQERSSGVIFSLEEGHAWASWPGSPAPVRLGPEHEVTRMMEDFIAQVEVGQRLAECPGFRRTLESETV